MIFYIGILRDFVGWDSRWSVDFNGHRVDLDGHFVDFRDWAKLQKQRICVRIRLFLFFYSKASIL